MPRLHILLIDSDPVDTDTLRELIASTGLSAVLNVAADVPAALQQRRPDLILLNPTSSDLVDLTALRDIPSLSRVPVAALAPSALLNELLTRQPLLAAQYVETPLDLQTLRKLLSSAGAFSLSVSRHP
ncbi:MAG: CheY-like chemotaxis protein [Myxococcota bacterium]|jgi:CheY-like chemotaxis protein